MAKNAIYYKLDFKFQSLCVIEKCSNKLSNVLSFVVTHNRTKDFCLELNHATPAGLSESFEVDR